MSTAVVVGGLTYNVPAVGESNWGQNVSDLLIAVAANISGSAFFSVVAVSSSPITVVSGRTYLVDTGADRQLNLPTPAANAYLIVKDTTGTAGTYNITIHRSGGEKIDGVAADKTLATNNGQWWIVSDGTDWFTLMNGLESNGQRIKPYSATYAALVALSDKTAGELFWATDIQQTVKWNGAAFDILG